MGAMKPAEMVPMLLAAAMSSAGVPSPGAAADPWVITSPVVIDEPTVVGDVIIVGGGSLHVTGVPDPGLQMEGSLWVVGSGELVLDPLVGEPHLRIFKARYHGLTPETYQGVFSIE